jgi:hypothetical protein
MPVKFKLSYGSLKEDYGQNMDWERKMKATTQPAQSKGSKKGASNFPRKMKQWEAESILRNLEKRLGSSNDKTMSRPSQNASPVRSDKHR